MRPPRIVNRGRIAPSSPKPIIDSGRNSWSTASAVSTIDTQSPEPNIAQQVNQKLEEDVVVPSIKKKIIIICIVVACVLLIVVGILLGTLLPHGSSTPLSVQIETTMSTSTSTPSLASKPTALTTNATGSTTITTTTTTTTTTLSTAR